MSIKISLGINDLERLLGGNDEVLVEVRQAAAAEFSKRYLKDFAKSEAMQNAIEAIKAAVNIEIKKQIGEISHRNGFGYYDVILEKMNPDFKKALDREVKDCCMHEVEGMLEVNVKKAKEMAESEIKFWEDKLNKMVDKRLDDHIERRIQEGIEARLKAALNA